MKKENLTITTFFCKAQNDNLKIATYGNSVSEIFEEILWFNKTVLFNVTISLVINSKIQPQNKNSVIYYLMTKAINIINLKIYE